MFDDSLTGIRTNLDAFNRAAGKLSRPETADLPQEMVNMSVAETAVEANLVALRTALAMSGRVLDILA
jgi:flagellar basal body rod protein FlgC